MVDTQRQLPLTPPGVAKPLAIKSGPPPLKDADPPVGIPKGSLLDLTSLSSMQMIITQNNMMGMLEYYYETRVISRISLHLTSLDFQDWPNTHGELKEQWACKLLLTCMQNLELSEYPLMKLNKTCRYPICSWWEYPTWPNFLKMSSVN